MFDTNKAQHKQGWVLPARNAENLMPTAHSEQAQASLSAACLYIPEARSLSSICRRAGTLSCSPAWLQAMRMWLCTMQALTPG